MVVSSGYLHTRDCRAGLGSWSSKSALPAHTHSIDTTVQVLRPSCMTNYTRYFRETDSTSKTGNWCLLLLPIHLSSESSLSPNSLIFFLIAIIHVSQCRILQSLWPYDRAKSYTRLFKILRSHTWRHPLTLICFEPLVVWVLVGTTTADF